MVSYQPPVYDFRSFFCFFFAARLVSTPTAVQTIAAAAAMMSTAAVMLILEPDRSPVFSAGVSAVGAGV